MSVWKSIRAAFHFIPSDNVGRELSLPASTMDERRQQKALRLLKERGSLTLADIGGNCPSKVAYRLRRAGYIKPLEADTWETGRGVKYKRYHYSGKRVGQLVDVEV